MIDVWKHNATFNSYHDGIKSKVGRQNVWLYTNGYTSVKLGGTLFYLPILNSLDALYEASLVLIKDRIRYVIWTTYQIVSKK